MRIAIIGSGIGGLALSVRLASRGHSVEVFEVNTTAGGKLSVFELGDFRFDGGPSLFTMPQYVEELFKAAGEEISPHFSYQTLDIACHYFWSDGKRFEAPTNPALFAKQAAQTFGVSESQINDYFEHIERIYKHSAHIFLAKPLNRASTWLNTEVMSAITRIPQFDIFKSMNAANESRIQEPHLVQLFNRFATYNGSDPYRASGILNVIPWFEHGFGTYFPAGGMRSIAQASFNLAERKGVRFHFNTPVDEILLKEGRAAGIRLRAKKLVFDCVVSNSDIHNTYRRLMPTAKAPERILNQEPSSSALVFYWGIDRSFEELGLHNIFFSSNYEGEFRQLFREFSISDDPTIYVNISSKCQPTDAPAGCENWFVMINAPFDDGQPWEQLAQKVRVNVINKLSAHLKTDIEKHITAERIWSPKGISQDTGSNRGSLYGSSSNSPVAAFMRHANKSRSIDNLYFCGGTVHPGGGIPLALLSAKITDELMAEL